MGSVIHAMDVAQVKVCLRSNFVISMSNTPSTVAINKKLTFHFCLYQCRTLRACLKNGTITFTPSRTRLVRDLKNETETFTLWKNAYYSKVQRSRAIDTSWEAATCPYLPTSYFDSTLFTHRHRLEALLAQLAIYDLLTIHNLLIDSLLTPAVVHCVC